jgi:hypothetical protein
MKSSEARMAALVSYVAEIQARMALSRWHIVVREGKITGCLAQVDPTEGRYYSYLTVHRKNFWTVSADEQRSAVVHELVHLIAMPETEAIRCGGWHENLATTTWHVLWEDYKRQHELVTDHLTTVFQSAMPLPPEWPE